jgi:aspartyl-tRNA(Asn)/glutamyl-tRNA(Gln) amidotransferase subunit B
VTPARFAELLHMLSNEEINANAAREVLLHLFDTDQSAQAIVDARGYKQVSDTGELEALVEKVLAEQPEAAEKVRGGQNKAMGFLVGQVMQASGGKANPKVVKELLAANLTAN